MVQFIEDVIPIPYRNLGNYIIITVFTNSFDTAIDESSIDQVFQISGYSPSSKTFVYPKKHRITVIAQLIVS